MEHVPCRGTEYAVRSPCRAARNGCRHGREKGIRTDNRRGEVYQKGSKIHNRIWKLKTDLRLTVESSLYGMRYTSDESGIVVHVKGSSITIQRTSVVSEKKARNEAKQ